MVKTLHILGLISIVGGIILGFIFGIDNGFRFVVALSWWIRGIVSGILFLAFAMMIELLEANNAMLGELIRRTRTDTPPSPQKSLGNSKASLDSLTGYKMKGSD